MSDAGAAMTGREPFAVSTAVSPVSAQNLAVTQSQQMCMPYQADGAYMPVSSSPPYRLITGSSPVNKHIMNLNSGEQRRKRGRPKKYGPDGSMAMSMVSQQQQQTQPFSPQSESQLQVGGSGSAIVKKARGRPPGSSNKKKQMEAFAGIGFIPHVIHVNAGEDVSSKIMAFSQNGPRAVCILYATGAISNVTLRQAATSGGTATYEGWFDILSLSGSFMLSEVAGQKGRTGGLSVTLAGPDGRVFGGCVAGLLIAATPVQVIAGSFLADGRKEPKSPNYMEPLSTQSKVNMGGGSSSPSRGTFSGSSGGPASPLNLSSGACNNHHPHAMSAMPWK